MTLADQKGQQHERNRGAANAKGRVSLAYWSKASHPPPSFKMSKRGLSLCHVVSVTLLSVCPSIGLISLLGKTSPLDNLVKRPSWIPNSKSSHQDYTYVWDDEMKSLSLSLSPQFFQENEKGLGDNTQKSHCDTKHLREESKWRHERYWNLFAQKGLWSRLKMLNPLQTYLAEVYTTCVFSHIHICRGSKVTVRSNIGRQREYWKMAGHWL